MGVRALVALAATAFLAGCPRPSSWDSPPPDDPLRDCDGDGPECTGSRCCDPGYDCQHGRCVDAAQDMDSDGYQAYRDCDDYSADTYPSAPELCDGVDNDCDGVVDDGVRDETGACIGECVDADGDGTTWCDGDCDDAAAAWAPGAEEVCDGVDNDCDEVVDDGDGDGDGVAACSDCDDADALAAPGLEERCDGRDNDCDGTADDGVLCGAEGECIDGACRWLYDAVSEDVAHECGAATSARWCSDATCSSEEVLVAAPAEGVDDLPFDSYVATVRARVAELDADCGPVFRIRVTDLDFDGSGTCRDCYFGGDRSVRPIDRDFPTLNEWYSFDVPFVIGPERTGHRIQVLVLRWRCTAVDVCIRRVRIDPAG